MPLFRIVARHAFSARPLCGAIRGSRLRLSFSTSPNASTESTTAAASPGASEQSVATRPSRVSAALAYLPGDSLLKKTAYLSLSSAIVAWLVKNGYYVVNHETLVAAAFILATRFLYVKLAKPVNAFLDQAVNEARETVASAGELQKRQLAEQLATLEQFRDYGAVTAAFCDLRKETVELERELAILQARHAFLLAQKARLDDAARRQEELKERLKKAIVTRLVESVKQALESEQVRRAYFEQALTRLATIPRHRFLDRV